MAVFLAFATISCKEESMGEIPDETASPNILLIIADDLGKDAIKGSVSYTHLDVYKRQIQVRSFSEVLCTRTIKVMKVIKKHEEKILNLP